MIPRARAAAAVDSRAVTSRRPSLHGRVFASEAPVDGGDVGPATVFNPRERDGAVEADHVGGAIRTGFLVGTCEGDEVRFRYVVRD
jgi:hypothetical protein